MLIDFEGELWRGQLLLYWVLSRPGTAGVFLLNVKKMSDFTIIPSWMEDLFGYKGVVQ